MKSIGNTLVFLICFTSQKKRPVFSLPLPQEIQYTVVLDLRATLGVFFFLYLSNHVPWLVVQSRQVSCLRGVSAAVRGIMNAETRNCHYFP